MLSLCNPLLDDDVVAIDGRMCDHRGDALPLEPLAG